MEIGRNYYIETVTWAWTGRLVDFANGFAVLDDAAKIFDTGRFGDAMSSGTFAEVEPVPSGQRVPVSMGAIVDAVEWPHPLPREQQ